MPKEVTVARNSSSRAKGKKADLEKLMFLSFGDFLECFLGDQLLLSQLPKLLSENGLLRGPGCAWTKFSNPM